MPSGKSQYKFVEAITYAADNFRISNFCFYFTFGCGLCFFRDRVLALDGLVLGLVSSVIRLGGGDSGANVLLAGRLSVELRELVRVELRALEDLALADVAVLERVDSLGLLLDLLANGLSHKLLEDLAEVARGNLASDNLRHFLADDLDLRAEGVAGEAALVLVLLGEANGEDADSVAVSGLHVNDGLNEGLPLADQRLEEVSGEGHAGEVGEHVAALDVLGEEVDHTIGAVLVLVEVTEGDLEDAALQAIGGEN